MDPVAGLTDVDEAEETALDVIGRTLFHPPGTKKYDLTLSEIHVNYQFPREAENCDPHFPGVKVSQTLHPAFGYNDEQRHKKLEEEADRFLRQYYPDALNTVSPVPLRQIAEEKMGLQVFTGYKLPEQYDTPWPDCFPDTEDSRHGRRYGRKDDLTLPARQHHH